MGDISRYEFEMYSRDMERRVARLEGEVQELERQHDRDMADLRTLRSTELEKATERRNHHREWTWGQIWAAVAAGAAVIGAWAAVLAR